MSEARNDGMTNDVVDEQIPSDRRPSKARMLAIVSVIVVGMFGFAYANAEFFVLLCQKAGILQPPASQLAGTMMEDQEEGRSLDVYFSAHVSDNLPIAFSVKNAFQRTAVNKRTINDYSFVNLSKETIYFNPVHAVSPHKAGLENVLVLEKCFCFDVQKLEPGERYSLPVQYIFTDSIDPGTYVVRMNYTLFPSTKERYDSFHAGKAAGVESGKGSH